MSELQGTQKRGATLNPIHWKIGTQIVGIVLTVVLLSVVILTISNYFIFSRHTIEWYLHS